MSDTKINEEDYLVNRGTKLWKVNPGHCCGFMVPTNVMKKLMKVSAKFEQEVRDILTEHKEDLHTYDWTMYRDSENSKEAEYVYFYDPELELSIDRRIELFRPDQPEPIHALYKCNRSTAGMIAKKLYEEK